jgi:thiamine kinase-like enzyme
LPDDLPIVFTHNDLHFSNILISPKGSEVVAITDWEASGFYPAYWEWAKLSWTEARRGSSYINEILHPHTHVWDFWIGWLQFACL